MASRKRPSVQEYDHKSRTRKKSLNKETQEKRDQVVKVALAARKASGAEKTRAKRNTKEHEERLKKERKKRASSTTADNALNERIKDIRKKRDISKYLGLDKKAKTKKRR